MVDIREVLARLEARETGPTEPYPSYMAKLREAEREHTDLIPFEIKGRRKLLSKYPEMRSNYSASLPRAKENYSRLPFGPRTKASFIFGLETGKDNYNPKIIVSHEKKWAFNWIKGVSK